MHSGIRFGGLFLALLFSVLPGWAAGPRRVLIIHSFGREFAPFDTMSAAFRTELARRSPEPLEFSEAAIEAARFTEAANDRPLVDYLRTLHADRPLDLILAVAEPAAHFALRNRAVLFPGTPLLVHADHRQAPVVAGVSNSVLVPVQVRLPVLLDNILEVLPATTNVVLVLGASPYERMWTRLCQAEFAPYTNRLAITYLNDLSLERMTEVVANLPPRSAVLYGMLAVDAAGIPHEQEQALAAIRRATRAPVFGPFERQLGQGIVGGRLLSLEDSGREAAAVALRLLKGEKVVTEVREPTGPGRHVYDWRELRRWGIPAGRLPAGSEVRHRPPSLWEEHRGLILATVAVLVGQVVTIAALLANRARRRRSEAGLRESEARMNLAAEAANLGLWVWDVAADEIWATGKCRALFGFGPDEKVRFGDFAARVHSEDRPAMEKAVREALERKLTFEIEYRACLPGGGSRWIGARGMAWGPPIGKSSRMLGVCLDLTERKEADLQIRRHQAELAHVTRVSAMGELAASLAHELNQPLGAILSNTEAAELLLQRQPPAWSEMKDILADIRRDDERAGEVIRRMRALFGKRELEFTRLDPNAVVEDVLRLVGADALARKTRLTTELASDLPWVRGDRVHLQQVLLNLILNAFEAMAGCPADGRQVVVRTLRTREGGVEVEVMDTGPGLEPGALPRLFQPFYTTKAEGLGMGLSIARTIVEAHGGRLAGRNNTGAGATFHFSLPSGEGTVPG